MKPITLLAFSVCLVACGGNVGSIEERIKRSEGLSRVDKLCTALPKPPTFVFKSKNLKGNSFKHDVGYLFKADVNHVAVESFYIDWFAKNGWSYDEKNSYSEQDYFTHIKDKQRVFVQHVGFGDANYSIRCQEVK